MNPPGVKVSLKYPRQTIALTSYTHINNFGIENRILAINVALQDIAGIIINLCRESGERPASSTMYIILKHYMRINSYNVERVVNSETDAIALTDIYNRNNDDEGVEYLISKVLSL